MFLRKSCDEPGEVEGGCWEHGSRGESFASFWRGRGRREDKGQVGGMMGGGGHNARVPEISQWKPSWDGHCNNKMTSVQFSGFASLVKPFPKSSIKFNMLGTVMGKSQFVRVTSERVECPLGVCECTPKSAPLREEVRGRGNWEILSLRNWQTL